MKKIKIYNRENAIEFLDYSQIAKAERIKSIVEQMYNDKIFAFGLCVDERPLGFIVAFKRDENNWQCDVPFFAEDISNGYVKQLLEQVITEVEKQHAESLYFSYMEKNKPSKVILETFTAFGFKPSGYSKKVFVIPKNEIEKFKVMVDRRYARYVEITNEKIIKPFCELTEKEIQQLKAEKGIQYPELYAPFLTDDIDLKLSRIIYINGDPVAWVSYKILGKSAMYVDRFFVKEAYRSQGLFFLLFYDTYINTPEEIKKLVLYIRMDNKKMLSLFRIFRDCEKTEDTTIELLKVLRKDTIKFNE